MREYVKLSVKKELKCDEETFRAPTGRELSFE